MRIGAVMRRGLTSSLRFEAESHHCDGTLTDFLLGASLLLNDSHSIDIEIKIPQLVIHSDSDNGFTSVNTDLNTYSVTRAQLSICLC